MDRWLASDRYDYFARLHSGVISATLEAFEACFSLKLPRGERGQID